MTTVILKVCQRHFILVAALEEIMKRNPNALRQQYLKPLVEHDQLKLAFLQYENYSKQGAVRFRGLLHDDGCTWSLPSPTGIRCNPPSRLAHG